MQREIGQPRWTLSKTEARRRRKRQIVRDRKERRRRRKEGQTR